MRRIDCSLATRAEAISSYVTNWSPFMSIRRKAERTTASSCSACVATIAAWNSSKLILASMFVSSFFRTLLIWSAPVVDLSSSRIEEKLRSDSYEPPEASFCYCKIYSNCWRDILSCSWLFWPLETKRSIICDNMLAVPIAFTL